MCVGVRLHCDIHSILLRLVRLARLCAPAFMACATTELLLHARRQPPLTLARRHVCAPWLPLYVVVF